VVGAGRFQFSSGTYQVDEVSSEAVITVRRVGGTSGPNPDGSGSVSVLLYSDGTAWTGLIMAGNHQSDFPGGRSRATINVPIYRSSCNSRFDVTWRCPILPAVRELAISRLPTLTIINADSTSLIVRDLLGE